MMRKILVGAAALAVTAAMAATVELEFLGTGAMPKMGGYMPQRLSLTTEAPAGLVTPPEGLKAPLYGELKLGPKDDPTVYIVIVDEPAGEPARLFVDANANGDLTDDAENDWAPRNYNDSGGTQRVQHSGGTTVTLPHGDGLAAHVPMYRFDPEDTGRAQLKDVLLYYTDYGFVGTLELGDKTYNVMLTDDLCTGDFTGAEGERSGVRLMIDVNGNGQFDRRGEQYDVRKPFNIGGTTYEVGGLTPAGGTFEVTESAQTVDEILPPPDLSPGRPVIEFAATTLAGDEIEFPKTFAGKVVLLDFWATWCGPCIAELPHLTAAYEQFHERGFEVLGISLDRENMAEKVNEFTAGHNMPWAQVYDGRYWQAEIAQLYVVDSIPRAFLVDGDTGEILAAGNSLRGAALAPTIERALAAKGM